MCKTAAEHPKYPASACLIPACPASSDNITKCTRQTSGAQAQTAVRKSKRRERVLRLTVALYKTCNGADAQWLHGPCRWAWWKTVAVCLRGTAGLVLSLTHTHTLCKKLRDRCLFMSVKEHMCTWTHVLCEYGDT